LFHALDQEDFSKEGASYKYRGFNASKLKKKTKKRHGHTQERGPKGERKSIEGKKS